MDWIAFLHIFTIFNKALLFPLFFFKKNSSLANKLLALLILLPLFPILSNYIFYTASSRYLAECLFLSQLIFSFFGPIFLFYCMEMLGEPFKYSSKKLIHLIPPILVMLLWLSYAFSSDISKQKFIEGLISGNDSTLPIVISSVGAPLIVLIYILLSAALIYKKVRMSKDVFTNLETLKINYIREFIWVIVIEIAILSVTYTFTPVLYVDLVWVPLLGNIMYFYIIYKSYNYGTLFSEKGYQVYKDLYEPLNQYIEATNSNKYLKSALSSSQADEYSTLLTEGFETQHWHHDPELNLNTLSLKSGIPAHHISQIINQKFKKNFFDLVNFYRVEAFKTKVEDNAFAHLKLEELAYMCGFNSKATFQRAFKKHTGMTPSEYQHRKIPSSLIED